MDSLICSVIFIIFVCSSSTNAQLYEDDVCKVHNNVKWSCKRLEDCPSALQSNPAPICAFRGMNVLVCCEPSRVVVDTNRVISTTRTTKVTARPGQTSATQGTAKIRLSRQQSKAGNSSKSVQKCLEYAKAVFQKSEQRSLLLDPEEESSESKLVDTCNINENALVIDGTPTKPREFPHQVNFGYRYATKIRWGLCTGSLISERFVLTAAHCSRTLFGAPEWAVVGDLDIYSDTDDARPEQLRILQHIDHPKYWTDYPYNDIALYKLERDVVFDGYKRPACLNVNRTIKERQGVATGWGVTKTGGENSAILLKVRLDLVNRTKCSEYWPQLRSLKNGIDDDRMICAGDLVGKKDTCGGDSGGPLQNALKAPYCMYGIIGVTSFGRKVCGAGAPGVYTRVSHYVPWIESIVWP